jgi:DNA phosphorothioation-associated putative methyltransferase
LPIGKRLPDAVYLHQSYLDDAPSELTDFVERISDEHGGNFDWNVLKLHRRDHKVTLLSYPGFDEDSYPPLEQSLTIDLVRSSVRRTSFANSDNPPILHRKETLVPDDYPHASHFAALTEEGERAGLYEDAKRIGFRKNWERFILQKGYALIDGRIVRRAETVVTSTTAAALDIDIQRHLTAVDRDKLSTPMQSLARHGYLDGDHSILDFGCGKGHDLLELEAHGLDAIGWDPAFRPDGTKRPSDIVNLGFVINVIEDRSERSATLTEAYSLAKTLLVVAVMLGGDATTQKFTPYKDGVVTSRGTFQKYYTQAEIRDFIETTLSTNVVPVGAGLFYVFKDELEEQEFLARRQRIKREWNQLVQRDKASPIVDHQALIEKNLDLFKDFWTTVLDLGRPPANDEFERSEEIRKVIGSHRKALHASKDYFGENNYEVAKLGRKKDLTVFLALSFFDRHRAYARMPLSLQRDIRNFFGKPSDAYEFARQALFAIADTELIGAACENAHSRLGCGALDPNISFTFQSRLLVELPPILRIYVGCAAQLYGDIESMDLIKIHIASGKTTLLRFDNFHKRLPILTERIKIRLRDQYVDYFLYKYLGDQYPLYCKSRYMMKTDEDFEAQLNFDKSLAAAGIDISGYGPTLSELKTALSGANWLSEDEVSL